MLAARDIKLNEVFLSALETFPSFVIVDKEGTILYINENYTKILGITEDDAIGKNVESVIPNTRLPIVLKTGREEIGELMKFFDHGADKDITLVCNRIPIMKGGQVIGAIGQTTIKDIDIVTNLYEEIKVIKWENSRYKAELDSLKSALHPFENLVGASKPLLAVKKAILDYADTNLTILLTGETGTGKEPSAKAIHHLSKRSLNNYVKINCAAIPADLLESELFGYVEGAFTGAGKGGKVGKYELADNGTLLLDEIGEMSLDLQAKLLRVLQEGEFEPVGSVKTRKANVRLLCSTNKNLEALVAAGRFREDLYYRINVVEIKLPPLRERLEDLDLLCKYIVTRISRETGRKIYEIADTVIQRFSAYSWPGNVRELEHAIERAAVMCRDGTLSEEHFDFLWAKVKKQPSDAEPLATAPRSIAGPKTSLKERIHNAEKQAILDALEKAGGNKTRAASLLNIDRTRLYGKLRKHKLL